MDDHEGRFLLADEQDAFKERAGNLFSALDDVQYSPAQEGDSFLKSDPVKDGNQKFRGAHIGCGGQNKNVTGSGYQHGRGGGSSTMPPPRAPPMKRRCRRPVPGHMQNPSKYTKYSLADVPDSQLSQKSNTAAALAFLTEIDARQNKDKDEDKESQGNRPLFKKPVRKTSKVAGEGRSPTIPSESGSADASQNKAKSKSKSGVAIKLSHLEYEDEE